MPSPFEQQASTPLLLSVRDLSQAYQHRMVLRQVSCELHTGEIVVLLGRNGTGKTTLLKVLARLLKALRGSVDYGPDFHGASLYVPDGFLYEDLTVTENLDLYARLCRADPAWRREMAQRLDLAAFADSPVRSLSRGQKARAALCRSFLPDVSLYLLDEPLTGLDRTAIESLARLLVYLRKRGKTVLLATHQIESLTDIADRWWQMDKGRPVALADPLLLMEAWKRS